KPRRLKACAVGGVEDMDMARSRSDPDAVAGADVVAFPEQGDDLDISGPGVDQRFGASRFDHRDADLDAVVSEFEMLRPDAIDDLLAVRQRQVRRREHSA